MVAGGSDRRNSRYTGRLRVATLGAPTRYRGPSPGWRSKPPAAVCSAVVHRAGLDDPGQHRRLGSAHVRFFMIRIPAQMRLRLLFFLIWRRDKSVEVSVKS